MLQIHIFSPGPQLSISHWPQKGYGGCPLELTRKVTLIRTARQTTKLQTEGGRYKRASKELCLGGAVPAAAPECHVAGLGGGHLVGSTFYSHTTSPPRALVRERDSQTSIPTVRVTGKVPGGREARWGRRQEPGYWGGCVGLACVISPAACLPLLGMHLSTLLTPHPDPFRLMSRSSQLFLPHFKKSFPISKSQL